MPTDHIRYDLLAQEALRGVVRHVLADIAKSGVPGDHHFYVTFQTRAPGVKLSQRLLAQYPQEMRIVLQHQFWDLLVTDEAFEVGLSFGGVAERLMVPFSAVIAFLDPSVQFGLQFTPVGEALSPDAVPSADAASPTKSSATGPAVRGSGATETARASAAGSAKIPSSTPASAAKPPEPPPTGTSDDEPEPPAGGAEVVRLDRFRKK
jgi:uncharacterized protein